MWTTLAVAAALSLAPSQGGALELTNVRATYGPLGIPRPDNKILPGDIYFLAYDIEGIKTDETGQAVYGMTLEVTDSKGKVHFKQGDKGQEKMPVTNLLGGTRIPGFAVIEVGLDFPAGEYTVKVVVTDLTTKKIADLSKKFEVLPVSFGIVRLVTTYDVAGNVPAPMSGVVGQLMTIHFVVVGFERDKSTKPQPDILVEMRILDENGKPTLAKPISDKVPNATFKEVPPMLRGIDFHPGMSLTRPGKFTVELKVTDNLSKSKKPVIATFPLTVLAPEKGR
jgi:hypothetical protein